MNRKLWLPILLSMLCLTTLTQGCTSPTCDDYIENLGTCRDKIVGTYGTPVVIENKDNTKTPRTCKKETERQDCGVGNFCAQAPGSAFALCYTPGNLYGRYQSLLEGFTTSCSSIFAVRQSGANSYHSCIKAASCDLRKIDACHGLLRKEKEGNQTDYLMGFAIFLGLTLLIEGFFLFFAMRLTDGLNPKVTLTRALVLAVIVAVIGYPAVHLNPLLGMIISSSVFFILLAVLFHQGAGLPTILTGVHLLWVAMFFNFMVSKERLGNASWLFEAKNLRIELSAQHEKLHSLMKEYDQTQREIEASRLREKKEAEEKKAKEEAEKKAKEEAAKKAKDDE